MGSQGAAVAAEAVDHLHQVVAEPFPFGDKHGGSFLIGPSKYQKHLL